MAESETDGLSALQEATRGTGGLERFGEFDTVFGRLDQTTQYMWIDVELA